MVPLGVSSHEVCIMFEALMYLMNSVQIRQIVTVYVNVSLVMPAHILNFVSQTQSIAINRKLKSFQ